MKRILINATHEEELRIAIARGQYLENLIIESTTREQKQSNIYKALITRRESSLEAAFVNYGEPRHGFLSLKEISRSCFKDSYQEGGRRPTINEVLEEDQELILQVKKEERDLKGAALTSFISLPGCYLVLMPNNPRAGGISRRIDDEERDQSHTILSQLTVPEDMGVILRTAGSGRNLEELQWDLDILLKQWATIQQVAKERKAPFLIYQEGNAVIRTLRDYLRKDIDEILIDDDSVYEQAINHLKLIRPDFINRVKPYRDPTPLFTRFQIESQIESAFQREMHLPSGGSIVIDRTEALIAIDVNSAKATKGGDIEETALQTNLEAADEVARQLRLRDMGGLIVIDFIDMTAPRNQRDVEERLKRALAIDRARVQIGHISRFGLLEMSRQRLRPSLGESSQMTCPRCLGQGSIRGIESLGLSVIRLIEEEALKENTAQVRAILPIEIATYILNEKRQTITDIEKRHTLSVIIVAHPKMETPQYRVERIRSSEMATEDKTPSYKLTLEPETESTVTVSVQKNAQEPAIKGFISQTTAPAPTNSAINISPPPKTSQGTRQGLLKRLLTFIFDKGDATTTETGKISPPPGRKFTRPSSPHGHRRGGGRYQQNSRQGGNRRPPSRHQGGRPFESRSDNKPYREHRERPEDKDRKFAPTSAEKSLPSQKLEEISTHRDAPSSPVPESTQGQQVQGQVREVQGPARKNASEPTARKTGSHRFYPGQSRRRFEPSKKSAGLRRTRPIEKQSSSEDDK